MPRGRHEEGRGTPEPVRRRCWEPEARAEAARLGAAEPGWVIFYGVWSRRYYAFAIKKGVEPAMVDAPIARVLRLLMRDAEDPDGGSDERSIGRAVES
ncbi:hypothetical protein Skr01_02310 [Sphaerisporangium krabiense]|nr:hypothetical protein Skr01_02310 [Sphaerisporangium krabiense]